MFDAIVNLLDGKKKKQQRDQIAKFLQITPDVLDSFEREYAKAALSGTSTSGNLFEVNSRQASEANRERIIPNDLDEETLRGIMGRIVDELLLATESPRRLTDGSIPLVTNEDLQAFPEKLRPQLTGTLAKVDLADEPSCYVLLQNWISYKGTKDENQAKMFYNLFRQGMDILDLDPITYEMLVMNPNSIGYWFPALQSAVEKHAFFKVPETRIVKVPLPILQLTRQDYFSLTPATLKIVDDWAMKAFNLDIEKSYFIKTGTYSSKFDFRNCKVTGEKEVEELGEYLLYIHWQANQMASPLNIDPETGRTKSIYGVSTTNEWCVREFIEDVDGNGSIYKGLPLHTEYRVFVDFDAKRVLGVHPYWDPEVMKKRFGGSHDSDSPHQIHDYIIYEACEEKLMSQYNKFKEMVVEYMAELMPDMHLTGQWSIDVMQNGLDFWIIDMALAENSAFYDDVVPAELKKPTPENWIPNLVQVQIPN